MSRDPYFPTTPMLMILATDDIVKQPASIHQALARANLSIKQVVEDVLIQWAQNESNAYLDARVYGDDPIDQIATYLVDTYINDTTTPYLIPVYGHPAPDYDAAVALIYAICRQVFLYLLPTISMLNPCEYQLQTFRIRRWLTDSLVIEIRH